MFSSSLCVQRAWIQPSQVGQALTVSFPPLQRGMMWCLRVGVPSISQNAQGSEEVSLLGFFFFLLIFEALSLVVHCWVDECSDELADVDLGPIWEPSHSFVHGDVAFGLNHLDE